jgi:hypothetical protein
MSSSAVRGIVVAGFGTGARRGGTAAARCPGTRRPAPPGTAPGCARAGARAVRRGEVQRRIQPLQQVGEAEAAAWRLSSARRAPPGPPRAGAASCAGSGRRRGPPAVAAKAAKCRRQHGRRASALRASSRPSGVRRCGPVFRAEPAARAGCAPRPSASKPGRVIARRASLRRFHRRRPWKRVVVQPGLHLGGALAPSPPSSAATRAGVARRRALPDAAGQAWPCPASAPASAVPAQQKCARPTAQGLDVATVASASTSSSAWRR